MNQNKTVQKKSLYIISIALLLGLNLLQLGAFIMAPKPHPPMFRGGCMEGQKPPMAKPMRGHQLPPPPMEEGKHHKQMQVNRPQGNFKNRAAETLHLTPNQEQEFNEIAVEHHNQMKSLRKKQMELARAYFNQPSNEILQKISQVEIEKIKSTENHFLHIKELLTPKQQQYLPLFKKEALKIILQ